MSDQGAVPTIFPPTATVSIDSAMRLIREAFPDQAVHVDLRDNAEIRVIMDRPKAVYRSGMGSDPPESWDGFPINYCWPYDNPGVITAHMRKHGA